MFGLQEWIGLWKGAEQKKFRLVPVDWWAEQSGPLVVNPPAILGRSSTADVRLNDPWISRTHCEFTERDGKLVVRDLESRHGVFVNEERVPQAVLHSGDVLLLGVSRFRVVYPENESPLSHAESPSARQEPS